MHLAEAVLVLCAVCLNNAMMCCGSRLATAVLVTPPAALLIFGPFLARLWRATSVAARSTSP